MYGKVREMVPQKYPVPLGKEVIITNYIDSNLFHDIITVSDIRDFAFVEKRIFYCSGHTFGVPYNVLCVCMTMTERIRNSLV